MANYNRKYFGCAFEGCDKKHYSKGYCRNHYEQHRRGSVLKPLIDWSGIPYPDCEYDGCTNKSTVKAGGLCSTHTSRKYRGLPLDRTVYIKNNGYTEKGRVCKVCNKEKPLEEYYDRNQWRKDAPTCKATKCKQCWSDDYRRRRYGAGQA